MYSKLNLFLLFSNFVNNIYCDYLLVQKPPIVEIYSNSFLQKFNIKRLAIFDTNQPSLPYVIYTITNEHFTQYFEEIKNSFYIEYDQTIKLNQTQTITTSYSQFSQSTVPWHLDRIDSDSLDGMFHYNSSGSCHTNTSVVIDTYIIDTGIDINHPQFNGRAKWLANYANDGIDTDGNGHGTHCSGLVGSIQYGVCKDANMYAIKVLDSEGSGSLSGVIKGIEHAFNSHVTKHNAFSGVKDIKSIISMSLGGSFSRILNRAVQNCIERSDSFYIVVASGNENSDACKTSPASVDGVFSVMASNIYDERAYFSNFGKCTTMYSPGVNVESTIPNGKSAVYSGTSMATPILAGVLNHYIDMYPHMNLQNIKNKIATDAQKNFIKNNKKNTKNLFISIRR